MRKLIILSLCGCVLFVVGFGGYRGYQIWKQKHLMKQARQFLEKSDGANAMLCVRQALQSNPNNLEACRMMADFAEVARSPQVVLWRSKVVELEPKPISNHLALARAALTTGDAALAQRTLDNLKDADKNTPDYQKMAGTVALAARRLPEAEAHFAEAARLEPTNPVSELNLTILRLQNTNSTVATQAHGVLEALSTNPVIRCGALRELTLDALRHTNLTAGFTFSQRLLQDTNSTFGDRMMHLEILRVTTNSEQQAFLNRLQSESTNNPAKAYELAKWLSAAATAKEALAWLKTLPSATRTNLPVPLIEADCYMALNNWPGLLTNLVAQNWGELDCLRLASRARAYREQGQNTSAKTEWIAAVRATENRGNLLLQLLKTASIWRWPSEQEDILWAIVTRYPGEIWAVRTLEQRLFDAGRTRSLLALYSQTAQTSSTNVALVNNLAMTALLLEAWDKKPHDLAREVCSKDSTNASCVSTYAYSLLVQRKPDEALKTIERLKPEQLEDPGIAAYYGIILTEAGQPQKAKKYLELAAKARLLPEEQKLLEQARRRTG